VAFALSAVCLGASAWETTTFTAWSNETLQELLADSPWAGYANVSRPRTASTDAAASNEKALVTWTTALPIRQALVREAIGLNGAVPKDAEAFLALVPSAYVIALQISGAATSASYAAQAQEVQKETFITRTDGRAPLEPLSAEARPLDKDGKLLTGTAGSSPAEGGSTVFVFQFSKGLALTLLDREVEFVTKVGTSTIKKKFKLKDMVYKGELAL